MDEPEESGCCATAPGTTRGSSGPALLLGGLGSCFLRSGGGESRTSQSRLDSGAALSARPLEIPRQRCALSIRRNPRETGLGSCARVAPGKNHSAGEATNCRVDRRSNANGPLLVVAGEGSGDAMAAPVVRRLGVRGFGLGGPLLRDAGVELVGDVSELAALGIGPTLRRATGDRACGPAFAARNRATASPCRAARGLQRVQYLARNAAARTRNPSALVRRAADLGLASEPCARDPPRLRPAGGGAAFRASAVAGIGRRCALRRTSGARTTGDRPRRAAPAPGVFGELARAGRVARQPGAGNRETPRANARRGRAAFARAHAARSARGLGSALCPSAPDEPRSSRPNVRASPCSKLPT